MNGRSLAKRWPLVLAFAAMSCRGGTAGGGGGAPPGSEYFCSGDAWCWIAPAPQGDKLNDVLVLGRDEVWAAGLRGTLVRWDGSRWTRHDAGGLEDLHALWGQSADSLWLAGAGGLLRRWTGEQWETLDTGTESSLNAIDGTGPEDLWIVGDDGVVLHWDGGFLEPVDLGTADDLHAVLTIGGQVWIGGYRVLYHRSGAIFDSVPPVEDRWPGIYGLSGTGPDDVFLVGAPGALYHWNGLNWTAAPSGTELPIQGVVAVGPGEAYAFGQGGVVRRWDGAGWSAATSLPLIPRRHSFAGAAADDGVLWAVGWGGLAVERDREGTWHQRGGAELPALLAVEAAGDGSLVMVGGDEFDAGYVVRVPADGGVVEVLYERPFTYYSDLWVRGDEIWAVGTGVGTGGLTSHYDGSQWRDLVGDELLTSLWGHGAEVLAGGQSGVWRWQDSGWVPELASGNSVVALHGSGPDDVWALGGQMWRRQNGEWAPVDRPASPQLRSVAAVAPDQVWLVGQSGTALFWDGASWTEIDTGTTEHLTHAWADDTGTVWIAGYGLVLRHRDGTLVREDPSDSFRLFGGLSTAAAHWLVGDDGAVLRKLR